jgi:hypothetical protein
MTDILYAIPVAGKAVALYRDTEQRDFVATIFDRDTLGEYFTFNDGWCAVNARIVWPEREDGR